jgi:carboxymethylenebutenolidase
MTTVTIAQPECRPATGVIVLQEAFGVTAHIRSILFRLRDLGYVAASPHLYEHIGDPDIAYTDIDAAIAAAGTVERTRLLTDIDAALDVLERVGVPADRVGVIGFCMGGSAALAATCHRDVGAAVTFYGGGITTGRFGVAPLVDEVRSLRAPWLGLYGDQDPGIRTDEVERLRTALERSAYPTEIVRYPDAGHGFHCDARDSYEKASALDAWERTVDWLARHLDRR